MYDGVVIKRGGITSHARDQVELERQIQTCEMQSLHLKLRHEGWRSGSICGTLAVQEGGRELNLQNTYKGSVVWWHTLTSQQGEAQIGMSPGLTLQQALSTW